MWLIRRSLRTCLLTEKEKIRVCEIAKETRPAYIKTSTGNRKAGATVEDVRLIRSVVGDTCKIKAAGGIRDLVYSACYD